jgi:hypothetical protein
VRVVESFGEQCHTLQHVLGGELLSYISSDIQDGQEICELGVSASVHLICLHQEREAVVPPHCVCVSYRVRKEVSEEVRKDEDLITVTS